MRDHPFKCGEKPFSTDCPLCQSFYFDDKVTQDTSYVCSYCPVYLHTFMPECNGTPWGKAADAWQEYVEEAVSGVYPDIKEEKRIAWKAAADEQITFLEKIFSLLQDGSIAHPDEEELLKRDLRWQLSFEEIDWDYFIEMAKLAQQAKAEDKELFSLLDEEDAEEPS